jgi:hypothetical protein
MEDRRWKKRACHSLFSSSILKRDTLTADPGSRMLDLRLLALGVLLNSICYQTELAADSERTLIAPR